MPVCLDFNIINMTLTLTQDKAHKEDMKNAKTTSPDLIVTVYYIGSTGYNAGGTAKWNQTSREHPCKSYSDVHIPLASWRVYEGHGDAKR